jgi:parallel beta-helix repeat protein
MSKRAVFGIMLTLLLVSMFSLALNIQPARAEGTIYIRADGSVDPPDAPVSTVDDVTYILSGNITGDADGIVVERSNIIVDGNGYTVQGTGNGRGFYWSGINNVTIQNMNIMDFYEGIRLDYSSNNNGIIENNITANTAYGIHLFHTSNNNGISENNITNNGIGIWIDFSSSDNSIRENNIANNDNGILFDSSYDNGIIGDNIINNSRYGIVVAYGSSNNTINGNNATNNQWGISVVDSSNNSITGNNITANSYCGIDVVGSSYNTISVNNIVDNEYWGISFGVSLNGSSFNNTISANNISNNEYGIWLLSYYENKFYHNNFIENTQQVHIEGEPGPGNAWDDDYPSGGNYWSDYSGTDLFSGLYQNRTGSDGIGDTPYVIDAYNRDNYPLVHQSQYVPLAGDLNLDGTVDISDAILAALAFGSYPGHPRWNGQADLNQDSVVDIFDIIILASNFGKHSA